MKRELKCLYLVILLLVLVTCLHLGSDLAPTCTDYRSSPTVRTSLSSESRKLERELKRASMLDRTVILTSLSQSHLPILKLFLESFHIGKGTNRFLNHLMILSQDSQTYRQCKSIHPHCLHLPNSERKHRSDQFRAEWRRNQFLQQVLELGYHFLYTDVDVLWFRNPFLHFKVINDMSIACTVSSSSQKINLCPDIGFFYVKSNAISIEFFKYWNMVRVLHPGSHVQSVLETILQDRELDLGMNMKYLDTAYFSGFCQNSSNLNKVHTIHVNCCNNIEDKAHDMRILLSDWKRFKSESVHNTSSEASRRAHSKCLSC